ncbi:MAG: hypothetical protein IKW19_05950 [Akkermansia sp.]|nr:hypothetical protein [Akkermansia sp.]MBR5185823.1 hypothetical protein [Akkermansia sp.]
MKRTTTIGKMYAVTSAAGCTVTTPDGLPICTVEAGTQGYFTAPTSTVEVDDDAALLTATFNRAALALGLLGGGVKINWDKYAECVTVADMQAVNPDYKNDLTADGEWKWKLPSLQDAEYAWNAAKGLTRFAVELPSAKKVEFSWRNCPKLKELVVNAPNATLINGIFQNNPELEYLEIYAPKEKSSPWFGFGESNIGKLATVKLFMPLTKLVRIQNCTGLKVVEGVFPNVQGERNWIAEAVLDVSSALCVLGNLNAHDGVNRIAIGVHIDHRSNDEIVNAIEDAEAKGWTLTVRWNGTATAAAVSMWGRRNPVFARLGEPMEDGTPNLDWGHYVTDPSGYTEFASLDEAKEYFNIID